MSTSFNKSLFAAVLAWCLCQSAASAAVTYDWQFQTAASPASPDVGDPAATATITAGTGGGYVNPAVGYAVSSYWYLGFSGPDYPGSDPKVALSIPGTANQSLEFTLTVRQFVESGTFNGALTYTIDGGFLQNSWTRDEETKLSDGSFGGAWYYYSTSWQVAESVNPETVVIFGSPTGTLINSIQLGVEPVPEPIAGVLGAAGVAIAAAMFHQCRRRGGNSQPASRT